MCQKLQCPVCSYLKNQLPALLDINIKDEFENIKNMKLCPNCLVLWMPEEIPMNKKKNKKKR